MRPLHSATAEWALDLQSGAARDDGVCTFDQAVWAHAEVFVPWYPPKARLLHCGTRTARRQPCTDIGGNSVAFVVRAPSGALVITHWVVRLQQAVAL